MDSNMSSLIEQMLEMQAYFYEMKYASVRCGDDFSAINENRKISSELNDSIKSIQRFRKHGNKTEYEEAYPSFMAVMGAVDQEISRMKFNVEQSSNF